ncbi:TPA: DUF2116 family Zn-ribbon domain-containing protein [Candidatus Bathyarchaeota archaeon]|nr:DUF2116 family Zn-ribbon domain-containing protein [Candidatus Bathyarchaeota archaeon]
MPKHKHCAVCGISIPANREFCSEKCSEDYDKALKKRKYSMWIMMLVFPASLLLLMFLGARK